MNDSKNSAWDKLHAALEEGETLTHICFGEWGWSAGFENDEFNDSIALPVIPKPLRFNPVTIERAKPYLQNWSISGSYGSPDCYAITAWSDRRVFFISQYDGATKLESVPRNPISHVPVMPGG